MLLVKSKLALIGVTTHVPSLQNTSEQHSGWVQGTAGQIRGYTKWGGADTRHTAPVMPHWSKRWSENRRYETRGRDLLGIRSIIIQSLTRKLGSNLQQFIHRQSPNVFYGTGDFYFTTTMKYLPTWQSSKTRINSSARKKHRSSFSISRYVGSESMYRITYSG